MLNDILLLGLFTGDPTMVANYKIAYVIPANISIISSSIGIFVSPYFVKNENNYRWIRKSYKKIFLISTAIIGAVSLVLFIAAKPVIVLLYGFQYANVVPLMRILLIASFINCTARYTNANLLAAMGQIKYNLIISVIGVILQVIINVSIIPQFGAFGLAYTSIVVYLLMSVALIIVFFKKYKVIRFNKEK
jgi:O-antigen/teichoic acid export membrane protein